MEVVNLGHSRFGRAFAALSVAFVMLFSFFSPALALVITEPTDYPSSLNGYSVPENITVNTGETVDIIVTEPDNGNRCNISWGVTGGNVYSGTSGSSYWGKPSHLEVIGKHAGTVRIIVTISVFDGPYQQGVTRNRVYDDFNLECYVTVVGEDYIDPDREPFDPLNIPIVINDTDADNKTLVGFVEWMQARPDLTQQQIYDLDKALGVLQRAQNELFSKWYGGNNTGMPDSRNGLVTVVSDPSDAVSIINLQRSIQIMRDINYLRATDDIYTGPAQCSPARTNFYLMAVAATGADRGAGLRNHSLLQVSCENLAFGGYRTAASMWYSEKSAFISSMNGMGMQSLSSFQDAQTVYNTASGNHVTVGHYTNMFWAQDQIMGVGYTDYRGTACFNASALSNYGRYGSYSIDEFEALLNEYLGLHNWDEGTVSVQANCVSDGLLIRTCSDCGATMMETIPAGHIPSDPVSENVTPATCTADGVCDEVVYCSYCGVELSRTSNVVIPATGHNLTHYDAAVNSCTEDGHIEYWSCSNCSRCFVDADCVNEVSADSVIIPASGHNPVTDNAVAPSETSTGLTEGSHCSVCGTVLVPQSIVPALGGGTTQPEPVIIPDEEPAAPGTVNMYRLYNTNSGEHFYTSNVSERNTLASLGWNYEGIGWIAPAYSNTPVYRLYNENGGEHHYTMSMGERDALVAAGWNYEGIGWYSDDAQTVPLYRQYNPNAFANNHNYTTSLAENDYLVSLGWRAEAIGWYGVG